MTSFALLLSRLLYKYDGVPIGTARRINSISDALLTVFIMVTSGENFSELANAFCETPSLLHQGRTCDLRIVVVVIIFVAGNLFVLLPLWFTLVVLYFKRSHKKLVEKVRNCRRQTIDEAFLTIAQPIDEDGTLVAHKEDVLSVLQLSSRCIFCCFFELEYGGNANPDFNDKISLIAATLCRSLCCRCFNLDIIKHAFSVWAEDDTKMKQFFDANEFLEVSLGFQQLMRLGYSVGTGEFLSELEQKHMANKGMQSRHMSSNSQVSFRTCEESNHGKTPVRGWNLIKRNVHLVAKEASTSLGKKNLVGERSLEEINDLSQLQYDELKKIAFYSKLNFLRNAFVLLELALLISKYDKLNYQECRTAVVDFRTYTLLSILLIDRGIRYVLLFRDNDRDTKALGLKSTFRTLSNASNQGGDTNSRKIFILRFIGFPPSNFGDGIDTMLVIIGFLSTSILLIVNGPCNMADGIYWCILVSDYIRLFRVVLVNENLWAFSQPLLRLLFPLSRSIIVCFAFIYAFASIISTAFGDLTGNMNNLNDDAMSIGFNDFTSSILSLIELLAAEQTMDALYPDGDNKSLLWWRVVIISYIILVSLITINVLVSTVIAELEDIKDVEDSYIEWINMKIPGSNDEEVDERRESQAGELPTFSRKKTNLHKNIARNKDGEMQLNKSKFSINKPFRGYTAAGLT